MGARLVALLFALGLFARSTIAAGAPPVELSVQPVLGADAPAAPGWYAFVVRIANRTAEPLEGTLELSGETAGKSRAPFSLPPGQKARIELSWHDLFATALELAAVDAEGDLLHKVPVRTPRSEEPLLFDLSTPSRLAPVLRAKRLAVATSGGPVPAPLHMPTLSVTSPEVDARTGHLVLPDRAAGYASATLVLAPSDRLATLGDRELESLGNWVLGGGTLGISIQRPEDLRTDPLKTLLGAPAHRAPAGESLRGPAVFYVPTESSKGTPSGFRKRRISPGQIVADVLTGFQGANLRPSRWGAAASYGLGEVHLLGFDPNDRQAAEDEWVQLSVIELVRHAWHRKSHVALPHGATSLRDPRIEQVRRVLDPNEQMRWAVVLSALVLLVYAVGAGPLNFYLAARHGRPLRALWHLPVWAAAAMGFVLLTGVVAKGAKGHARHLTLVEAGAGMGRGAATRFRALFASSADSLTVFASDHASLLDVAGDADATERALVVDRNGARLDQFVTRPWETVVVREDGFTSLGGGVSLVAKTNGDVIIKNRLARDLIGAVVRVPGAKGTIALRYFEKIADGATIRANDGERVTAPRAMARPTPGHPPGVRALEAHWFASNVDEASVGLGAAWQAIESLVGYQTDWWPPDVPVLIAQVAGGEGRLTDSGLELDIDRVLIRVVGYGGEP